MAIEKKPRPREQTAEACQGKEKPWYALLVTGEWSNQQQMARLVDAPQSLHDSSRNNQPPQREHLGVDGG